MNPTVTKQLFACTLGLMLVAALSCKKLNNTSNKLSANATIVYEGNPNADGCGWLVQKTRPDSIIYYAPNLDAAYKIDGLKVYITYSLLTDKYVCGGFPQPLNGGITEIQITTIKKADQ